MELFCVYSDKRTDKFYVKLYLKRPCRDPRGITVNALCPRLVMTPAHAPESEALVSSIAPLGRAGTAEEIAGWIAFLASETAGYMTGQTVTIDGGLSAGYGVQTLGLVTSSLMAAAE